MDRENQGNSPGQPIVGHERKNVELEEVEKRSPKEFALDGSRQFLHWLWSNDLRG